MKLKLYIELAFIILVFCQPFLTYIAYKTGKCEKISIKNPLIPFFNSMDIHDEEEKTENEIWENVFNYEGSAKGQKEIK